MFESVNEIRLTPRTNRTQSCEQHVIVSSPRSSLFTYEDYFNNRVHAFTIQEEHADLRIHMKSVVVTSPESPERDPGLATDEAWSTIQSVDFRNRYAEYLLQTQYTTVTPQLMSRFERLTAPHKVDIHTWVRSLSATIHEEFRYDPGATTVHTTAHQLFQLRRGVCQDFAHYMISACRFYGIPARYVSGYQFIGDLKAASSYVEHASHAWVEVYIPESGWKAFDPTNDSVPNDRYVRLAHGRDYNDIVPVKGVYRGQGGQEMTVNVTVSVLDA